MGKAKIIFDCGVIAVSAIIEYFTDPPLWGTIVIVLMCGATVLLTIFWPLNIPFIKKEKTGKRISFLDLAKLAHKEGWDMMEDAVEVINLKDAILQSAIDGDIKLYGKPRGNPCSENFTKNAPLQEVPNDYFARCNLGTLYIYALREGTTEITGFANDNYKAYLQTADSQKTTYQDIHIKSENIKKWLKNAKKDYQGRRQKT